MKRRKPTRYLRMARRSRLTLREAIALRDAAESVLRFGSGRQGVRLNHAIAKLARAIRSATDRPTDRFGPRGRSAPAAAEISQLHGD